MRNLSDAKETHPIRNIRSIYSKVSLFRGTAGEHPVDLLRIYRIASYAKETYYYLEALAGNRPLAIRCGLNGAGQIIYLSTIE